MSQGHLLCLAPGLQPGPALLGTLDLQRASSEALSFALGKRPPLQQVLSQGIHRGGERGKKVKMAAVTAQGKACPHFTCWNRQQEQEGRPPQRLSDFGFTYNMNWQ